MDGIADHGEARAQSTRLLGQTCRVSVRGERFHRKAVRVAQQQIDRVPSDRSGRAEDRYAAHSVAARPAAVERAHCHVRMLWLFIKVSSATTGTTASKPSSLSRSPP